MSLGNIAQRIRSIYDGLDLPFSKPLKTAPQLIHAPHKRSTQLVLAEEEVAEVDRGRHPADQPEVDEDARDLQRPKAIVENATADVVDHHVDADAIGPVENRIGEVPLVVVDDQIGAGLFGRRDFLF